MRPNLTRMTFLDSAARSLYVNWGAKSRAVVGNLRLTAARIPDDRELADYIGITRPKGERNWLQKLLDRRRAR